VAEVFAGVELQHSGYYQVDAEAEQEAFSEWNQRSYGTHQRTQHGAMRLLRFADLACDESFTEPDFGYSAILRNSTLLTSSRCRKNTGYPAMLLISFCLVYWPLLW
jgi:hypothetical protein